MIHAKMHLFKTWFFVGLALVGTASKSFTQEHPKDATGTWMEMFGENAISKKWSIPVAGVLRQYDLAQETEFAFLRTGITYKMNDRFETTFGTAYLDTQPFGHDDSETLNTQFWLYEEFVIKNPSAWVQRFRFEHRWISTNENHFLNNRLRYRLRYKKSISDNLYLKCSDEPFFDFDEAAINQNRFYLGLGRKITSDVSFEVGYMKNHVGKHNYDRVRMMLLFKTRFFENSINDLTQAHKLSMSQ